MEGLRLRGDPATGPGEFDGYVIEKPKGWQAEAQGIVVGAGLDYEHAVAVAREHVGDAPVWRVDAAGTSRLG